MAKPKEKKAKTGRNGPCWCGSGKKYKDCHLAQEEAQRAEHLRLWRAEETLFPKIFEAAQTLLENFPVAFAQFWQDKYSLEELDSLDDQEQRGAERCLTWFSFDHLLADGRTLVETLAQTPEQIPADLTFDPYEKQLLQSWQPVRMRPYLVQEVQKGKGFTVKDLLNETLSVVTDQAASKRLEVAELLIAHIVPIGEAYHITGAAAQLTSDTYETLRDFMQMHLLDLQKTQPTATMNDLAQQRSYIFNHLLMSLPHEHNPSILEDILLQTKVALQLAGQSVAGIVGKEEQKEEVAPEEEPNSGDAVEEHFPKNQ